MALPPHKSRLSSIGPALVPKEQHQGKPAIRLLRPVYIIGSRSSARIHLVSSSVSKAHAIVVRSNGRTYIRDLASRTKIYINGREKREADLEDGDLLKIGSFTFQYIAGPGEDMVDPEAMKIAPPAKLDVIGAEYPVPFDERVLLVGRRTTCDVALVEGSVSTSHAAFFEIDGQRFIRDLGSRTGTFVNGVSTHQHQLSPGDVVRIGETEMRYVPNEVAPAIVVDESEAGAEIPSLLEAVEHHEAPIPVEEPLAPIVTEEPAVEEAQEAIPLEAEVAAKVEAPARPKIAPPPAPLAVEEELLAVAPVEELPADEPIAIAPADVVEAEFAPPALPIVDEAPPISAEASEPLAIEEPLAVAPVDEVVAEEPVAPAEQEFELSPLPTAEESVAPSAEAVEPVEIEAPPEPQAEVPEPAPIEEEPLEIAPAADAVEDETLAPIEPEIEPEPAVVAEVESPAPVVEAELLPPIEEDLELEPALPADSVLPIEEESTAEPEAPAAFETEPIPAAAASQPESVEPLRLAATDVPEEVVGDDDEYDITDTIGSAMLDLQTPAAVEPQAGAAEELPLDVAPPEIVAPIEPEAAIEVVEPTEPTPESALQESADQLVIDALASPDVPLDEAVAAEEGARNLTDTSFDRAVREFAGDELGEIVEPPPQDESQHTEAETETLDAVPETTESEPEVAQAESDIASVEAEASEAEPELELPEAEPELAEPEPELAEAEPELAEPEPELPEAEPELAEPDPELPEAEPELTEAKPELAEVEPEVVEAEPEIAEAQAEVDELEPQIAGAEAEPVEAGPELTEAEPKIAEAQAETSEAELLAPFESLSDSAFELPALDEMSPELVEPPPLPEPVEESALPQAQAPQEIELPAPQDESQPAQPAVASAAGPGVADLEFPPVDQENQAPEPAGEILKIRPPPPVRKPPKAESEDAAPAAPTPPAKPRPRLPWGANQDNFIGSGMPLNLIDPFGGATPRAPVPPVARKSHVPGKPPLSNVPISKDPMKDLIEEIDTVAAAAESALSVPPISAREFGDAFDEAAAASDNESSAHPSRENVATGFDGLAMPPVRELDVFSQMAAPAAHGIGQEPGIDDNAPADTDSETADESEAADKPERATVSRRRDGTSGHSTFVTRPDPDEFGDQPPDGPVDLRGTGSAGGNGRALAAYPAEELADVQVTDKRHQAFRRAKILVATMLVLLGLSGLGIYQFLGADSTLEGSVAYKNLEKLNKRDRAVFQQKQLTQKLAVDEARQLAHASLRSEINPGFLDDPVEYSRVVQAAHFTDDKPDVMLIPITSHDPDSDKARLAAVMTALYKMNKGEIEDAARNRHELQDLNQQIEAGQKKLAGLNSDIQRLQLLADSLPGPEQLKKLEGENASLEKAWQDAANAVTQSRAELEQLKSAPSTNVAAATTRPDDDEKIKAMQAQLDDLQAKADAAKQASAEQFDSAKKQLDGALDNFEKQLTDAQGAVNGSPEISSYLQDAQALQEHTRKLTDDLIKHQEQQFGSLMELKTRLNETMQQRRVEQWQKDSQLQELTERQAILTRQYNAAVGSGLDKEAADKKVELDLTSNMIKARQDLLPADSFYANAINQLQGIIDATKKNIDQDRHTTEMQLQALQQKFASSPAIQKLPQEQKQIADNIAKQLDSINSARQQYNKAIDAAGAAEADAQLKSQISTVQAGIEARRKQLAEENLAQMKNSQTEQARLTAIDAKQKELDQRVETASAAQTAFFDKNKELRDAQARNQQAKENADELNRLRLEKPTDEQALQLLVAQVENKTRDATDAVEPIEPMPNNDISITLGNDRRLLYTLSSFGTILLIFGGLVLWTLHSASMDIPQASMAGQPSDVQAGHDQPASPADGDEKKGSGPEEDHEPATI